MLSLVEEPVKEKNTANGLSKMSAKSMLKLSDNYVHLQCKSLGCNIVSKMPGNTNGYTLEVNEAA